MKDGFKGIGIYVFIILMLVLVLIMGNFDFGLSGTERLTDDKFYADLESGQIDRIQVEPIKVGTAGMETRPSCIRPPIPQKIMGPCAACIYPMWRAFASL